MDHRERIFLDEKDLKQLVSRIEKCEDEQFETLITAILFTGMRHGEALALTRSDIDFEHRLIKICRNVRRLTGRFMVDTPKTESSNRIVKILENIVELLKQHKLEQEKIKYLFQGKYVSQNLVFANAFGNFLQKSNVNGKFKRFLKKNNLPKITIHGLRHANASLLINLGIPTKIIADHPGHSNTSITENVYAHVFKSAKAKISDILEFKLFKEQNK
jgi:integrase